MFQYGTDFLQKDYHALVPLGQDIPFVANGKRVSEALGHCARFNTVSHQNKKTRVAGKIETSDWRRRS
jgi:hypothetical protein